MCKQFLVCCVISIILFGFIYSLMIKDINNLGGAVKESFSLTASFFGGITTLAAAYIALVIYENWKVEYNKNIEKDF
ncbi:hypothetical protein ATCC19606_25290 [Acinetobacter baumannii]|uniref:Uncharacterized protein n=1 Tax=Acinetobacter baumannii TaxID=470 RepID=A0A6F8THI0_ACIBA|nr:hypothetical protein ATCC19606_25290 [Acinetobacter baumannii]